MTARLLATMLALTAVLLGVLVVPLGIATARSERRDLRAKVERDAQAVASLSEDVLQSGAPATPALKRLAARYLRDTGGRIVVVDRVGTSIVDASSQPGRGFASRPEIATALSGTVSSGVRHSNTLGTNLLYVAVPVASGGVVHGAARITYPTATADERVRRTWLALGAISAFALAVAAGLAVSLARWASRPLVHLERAAEDVAVGDLTARAPLEGPPEVRAVASSFNAMVDRVQGMLDDQSAFVADASHQLRTPLTALRLRLENLAAGADAATTEGVAAATAEVDRLADLVDGLLALARADAGTTPAAVLDARALVVERVDAWAALASERELTLRLLPGAPLRLRAARERVEQVLDNLLSNAVEAVAPGGTVEVELRTVGRTAELRVRDDGEGLSVDERRRAFDRFWRGRETPGSGLGLAIARRLVEADAGTIELTASPAGGLEAIVRYPLA